MPTLLRSSLQWFSALCLAAGVNAAELNIDVQKKVLDNGVTVLVWERESAGRVGARSFYKVDIAAERPGTVGLVHMLEHHLFKGDDIAGTRDWEKERAIAARVETLARQVTDAKNSQRQCLLQRGVFAELENDCSSPELDALRAELAEAADAQNELAEIEWYFGAIQSEGGTGTTASTGRDWMKFDVDLPANKLELFMWAERSRVENPVFRHFEPEKEVVIDQIRRYDNNPDGKFNRVLRSMTYDAHPYGWAHWFSDLTQATREDHWEIFYKYFIPQNLVLVVVGDVEAEQVYDMAEAYFGSWQPVRPSPRLRTVEPEPVGQKRLTVTAAAGPAVAINVPMPAVGHADAPVFDMLAELLGGPRGQLAARLVDEKRLATEASASAWTSKYPSHFAMQVKARDNAQLDAVEGGINAVLADIAAGAIDDAQLQAASDRLVLTLAQNLEEIGRSAVTIGAMETIYDWRYLNALPALWASVSKADLQRVIQRYFSPKMQIVGHLQRESKQGVARQTTDSELELASLNTVRPGHWPVGGPVDEFFLADLERGAPMPREHKRKGTDRPNLQESGILGLTDTRGNSGKAATRKTASTDNVDIDYGDTLAIAEQPWYVPPFMARQRAARFSEAAPTRDYRELAYPETDFRFPVASNYRVALDNGISSYIVSEHLLPQVRITALVDAPSLADLEGKAGLGALTAQLLRKGSVGMDAAAIEQALNRMGATLTIQHDRRSTRLNAVAPADQAQALISLIGEILSAPDFAAAFEDELERMALAAERADDNALYATRALFDGALYGDGHPMGARASAESIRSITLEDVRTHHRTHYTSDNIALVISGAVDREQVGNTLRSLATLNALPGRSEGTTLDFDTPMGPQGLQVHTRQLDTRQAQVMLGHLGIEGRPDDHAALEIMHHILAGGGFASRMMGLLRAETGITSALYGEVEPGRGAPAPYVWRFGGRPETLAGGIGLALQEIRRLHEDGVTAAEFEAARTTFIDGLIPASYDTAHKVGLRLAHRRLFGHYAYQSPQYLNYYAGDAEQIEALRALTLKDVNAAAKKYLDPANLVIAVTGQLDVIRDNAPKNVRRALSW